MGPNVDEQKLSNYSNYVTFLPWSNLNNPQPDNWNQLYWDSYNCDGTPNPTQPMTIVAQNPQRPADSQESAGETGSLSITPAFTCYSHIPFAYDTSNSLTADQFSFEKNLILGPFLTTVVPNTFQPSWFLSFALGSNFARSRPEDVSDIATYVDSYPQLTSSGMPFPEVLSELYSRDVLTIGDKKAVNTVIFTATPLQSDQIADAKTQAAKFVTNSGKLIVVFMKPD
ncbi:hypothetical protein FO519_010217, partial [Halicephalobus sp. NKZ332]